jgi:ferredoxin-NADP reductase
VRGIPTVGVANVRKLFTKVVIVATGSGIGPVLGHVLDTSVPSRLVWVTNNPRHTFGEAFVEEIEAAQPDALIWDTGAHRGERSDGGRHRGERSDGGIVGKPDVLRLAYDAYTESGAEAVICVSNRTVTREVVHGLERCGIPAFGPIWDS